MTSEDNLVYAGDIEPSETWAKLKSDPGSVLVDVRTSAEWNFVGVPDLSELDQSLILLEWQQYPEMNVNPDFVATLQTELSARGCGKETPIYFLCRSGVRSRAAADAMMTTGFSKSYNVLRGFEGGLDDSGQRGKVEGWKESGLPWRQK
ncbi:MAG: rhodanese-like domain-containing protein [Rhizobiales bacterium]|nr:rhodanese-like domain-containing protein [Hyphomicrobiales bacterium]